MLTYFRYDAATDTYIKHASTDDALDLVFDIRNKVGGLHCRPAHYAYAISWVQPVRDGDSKYWCSTWN